MMVVVMKMVICDGLDPVDRDNQVEALEQQLRAERRFLEEQAAEREVGRHRHPD